MNKNDLIEKISLEAGLSKADANRSVDAFIVAVKEALSKGDKVELIGFGSFSVAERSARTGRNPQTGEVINIPAATVPKFKPGKALKDAVK